MKPGDGEAEDSSQQRDVKSILDRFFRENPRLSRDLAEYPVIGAIFDKYVPKTYKHPLYLAAKCIVALVGGGICMLTLFMPNPEDSFGTRLLKVSASMGFVMGTAKVVFNRAGDAAASYVAPCCTYLYDCVSKRRTEARQNADRNQRPQVTKYSPVSQTENSIV